MWTYDDAGNILKREEYAYTTGELGEVLDTVVYTYGDDSWGDLLTAYDGATITYDEIGNPLSDGTWTYTWERGRQLAAMSDGTTTWTYTYDADGMRTSRTNGTDTYTYVYNGGLLTQMTKGNDTLFFTYDALGMPATVTHNGTVYFYLTTLQGDVLAIVDANNEIVVEYITDAWGKIHYAYVAPDCPIAELNPLIYRGYVYDIETGLYYLQSRYYSPEVGRFLNADGYTSTGQGILGCNMFAYCGNNPIIRTDAEGTFWKNILKISLHAINTFAVVLGYDTAAFGASLLDMSKDDDGVYHADFYCWQRYFGYNSFYDRMFDAGTSMKAAKFSFVYGGSGYTIWAWKGDYINLGAGAELGIYRGNIGHRTVDTSLAMQMSMTLKYKGQTIINYSPSEHQWWITGFNPQYLNISAGDLTAKFTLRFKSKGMFQAFRKKYSYDSRWRFYTYGYYAIFQF